MTQKERQARSREEIYRAALEEFGTLGYDPVSMEKICGRHGISKGMMYHYFSNKDQLFLLCVERTFADLKAHVERSLEELSGRDSLETIRGFFLVRESYFRLHPRQQMVFEEAMLHPPKHLVEQIRELRTPIREVNRRFIRQLVEQMHLRPGMNPRKAARYLESMDDCFLNVARGCRDDGAEKDLHAMLESAGELLDMILFGILQQSDGRERPPARCETPENSAAVKAQ